jgi:hypothetical protein
MPCRDWDDMNTRTVEVDRPVTVNRLCAAYRIIEQAGLMEKVSVKGRAWWEAHKVEDARRKEAERKRLAREEKRKHIIEGLTDEQCKILGIKK